MGRDKPSKPRKVPYRAQWRTPKLMALNPPGAFYADHTLWYQLEPGQVPEPAAGNEQIRDLVAGIAPLYGGQVPPAALLLAAMIDRGTLLLLTRSGREHRLPVSHVLRLWGQALPPGMPLAAFMHMMHADGCFLITDAYQLRPVMGTPATDHGRWVFLDTATDEEDAASRVLVAANMVVRGKDPDELRAVADALAEQIVSDHGNAPGA